ncbi:flagellar assembly protein A [Massilia sp. CFBP9012]|uniref:flagellar assembly protein A n=1 Tax=Massilia sp. CFBP9012 TaxID=3096531 RepID=UPI002A6A9E74|nr:flagellar assembly protein A [Massilia sp. CFBP9012]MDY0977468.1 flagellar assembly protein A [Massilia sp. CFBP9012]
MSDLSVPPDAVSVASTAVRFESTGPEHCIARRDDGVYADPEVLGTTLAAAVDGILRSNHYLAGLDYPILIKAVYGHGPDLPRDAAGRVVVRIAADIVPFTPQRQALYRSVKIADGQAEYYFEPVFERDEEGNDRQTRLDADEFVADMWVKGIRFGAEVEAIRSHIASGAAGRYVVARRLDPLPGVDAGVEEVANELHRSDAPRQLANGKLDLMSFQNRFPQVAAGTRLLRKVPRTSGSPGFDLNGIPVAPEVAKDLDLATYAADGTAVELAPEGEFLVARQDGFLSVDPKSIRIAITDKIVSRDGVSAKTTGNLHLAGDYEEFGEVQEQRIIEAESITVHGDVYGHLVSRGGAILLRHNLVGGSARNLDGGVRVLGVASQATIQATKGEIRLERAENCVISGARIRIETAINCEIIGDEVEVAHAEGSAIAGRRVAIGRAAPWKQGEMLVWLLRPDCARVDAAMAQVRERMDQFAQLAAQRRSAMEALTGQPEMRKYLLIAPRLRKGELVLTPEQEPQFRRLTASVAPALKELGRLSQEAKTLDGERQGGMALMKRFETQRFERVGSAGVAIGMLAGEVQVLALPYEPDLGCVWDMTARDVKLRLRDTKGREVLYAGCEGAWSWDTSMAAAEAQAAS